jgi:glycosyltransferase involved in cell wall biosynthesis
MKENKTVIFLGSPLPEKMVGQYSTLSFNTADNIAQNVMIKGLHAHYGSKLTVVTELSKKYPQDIDLHNGVKALVITSNDSNRLTYYFSLMINYTRTLNDILKYNHTASDIVIVTRGAYIFVALAALLARIRYGAKWVPFIITTVEVPEYGFPLNIISKMSRWTSRRADGVITYVAKTAKDYMPGKPFIEIVYSIDEKLIQLYKKSRPKEVGKFTIAYTGSLSNTYNFDYIIESIIKTGTMFHWVFAGTGPHSERIKDMAADDNYDVDYLGPISNLEAIKLQKSCQLLLCPRGGSLSMAGQYYSKYAASGKLIEYLCSGTPILASDVPSTLEQIKPFITFEKGQEAEQFISDILDVKENYAEKLRIAKEGQRYAFRYFNASYQNSKVYDFLESL